MTRVPPPPVIWARIVTVADALGRDGSGPTAPHRTAPPVLDLPSMDMPLLEGIDDSFLAELIAESRDDSETVGLLLHGSRALATHRDDSDYDLIRIVTEDAYAARRDRNALVEKSAAVGLPKLDVLYQSQARVERYVADPGWYTATYLSAKVLFVRIWVHARCRVNTSTTRGDRDMPDKGPGSKSKGKKEKGGAKAGGKKKK